MTPPSPARLSYRSAAPAGLYLLALQIGKSSSRSSHFRPHGHRTPSYQTPVRDGLNRPFAYHLSTTAIHPLEEFCRIAAVAPSACAVSEGWREAGQVFQALPRPSFSIVTSARTPLRPSTRVCRRSPPFQPIRPRRKMRCRRHDGAKTHPCGKCERGLIRHRPLTVKVSFLATASHS